MMWMGGLKKWKGMPENMDIPTRSTAHKINEKKRVPNI